MTVQGSAILRNASSALCFAWLSATGCAHREALTIPARWIATVDQGCKPGVAYELWFERGRLAGGSLHVLDPATWDGGSSLRGAVRLVAPMSGLELERDTVRFLIPRNNLGGFPAKGEIVLDEPLWGGIGKRLTAKVHLEIEESARAPWFQHGGDGLVFERVE